MLEEGTDTPGSLQDLGRWGTPRQVSQVEARQDDAATGSLPTEAMKKACLPKPRLVGPIKPSILPDDFLKRGPRQRTESGPG